MKFASVATAEAEGCLLAHSTRAGTKTFKKGRVLSAGDLTALLDAGLVTLTVARLEPDDLDENVAAQRLATAAMSDGLRGEPPFTGRVNLHAEVAGIFVADKVAIDRMNRIDPALTIATLPNYSRVEAGRMVATAKVIEFAASANAVAQAEEAVTTSLQVHPFTARRIGLIATRLPHLKESTMDKTRRVLDQRLDGTGSKITSEIRIPHTVEDTAAALRQAHQHGCEMFILFGASAVVDRDDVLPAAVRHAGGEIQRFGLPVDPGNLLLLGSYGGFPLIGAPGCARSPKENGFDWVLERTLAGVAPSVEETTGWGVGGLLMEIHTRPHPRELMPQAQQPPQKVPVSAVVLAAGLSSRMGPNNKLLATINGEPLIRRVVKAAIASPCDPVIVVSGHQADGIAAALEGLDVIHVHNPDYVEGMGTSLRAGVRALPEDAVGALILLGDMPEIGALQIQQLVDRFVSSQAHSIVAAGTNGRRANPVLWPSCFFPRLSELSGDIGARAVLEDNRELLEIVEIGEAARLDLDTPETLRSYLGSSSD
ncbi:molybdopterin-binding/glycosyltransferase family 2 protein [Roseibium sp. CAU 1637]|uniref:Molybdopterin-binding/glycosyltransferase family 2 protein n=1 Tax=Roseibium limicola TaxID=2816037 RepID=A0A939ESU7_9HYPH|nr:molybdopterin-binding/glycosyltransferase family 2 protein [Roseibium limicola]MBO0346489.1 molybdopterin-binding/glycosyltransferase family 2 protein [Roseibium limicola]